MTLTPELSARVTEEVKRLREERAASSTSAETIAAHDEAMRKLSISADDLAQIAVAVGGTT